MLGLIVHTQAAVQLHPFDPLLNIVGGLALGRLWKGDSSPSFLKKKKKRFCSWPSLLPQGFASLPHLWCTVPRMPHSPLPSLGGILFTDHEDGLDGLRRTLATSQEAILVCTNLPFPNGSGIPGGSSLWQVKDPCSHCTTPASK